jgi:hypothetical protein
LVASRDTDIKLALLSADRGTLPHAWFVREFVREVHPLSEVLFFPLVDPGFLQYSPLIYYRCADQDPAQYVWAMLFA